MNENNQIIIYQTEDGQTQVDVRMENDTVWLTTNQMATLFEREESNMRRHVINVFREGELEKENNVHFLHVNGVKKPVPFYNLDVINSVGYRVKSQRGVKFRQWVNKILKQYLVMGYAASGRSRRGPVHSSMSSGMCNFCIHLFLVQLTFLEYIVDVSGYDCSVFAKQIRHLCLSQPHGIVLHADIHLCLPVLRLIYDYLVVFVHSTSLFSFIKLLTSLTLGRLCFKLYSFLH